MRKRRTYLVAILIGLVPVFLCAGDALAQAKPIKISFATYMPKGKTEEKGMEYFKQLIEKVSNKRITVENFYGGVLGGERDQNELTSVGEIQLAITGNVLTDSTCPELMAMDVPYVVSNDENLYKLWDGPLGKRIGAKIGEKKNITILGVQRRGARNLTTANRKGLFPDELKGMKMRLPEIKTWLEAWKEIGVLPTPIDTKEIFTALQMGVVEGHENPASSVHSRRIWEVQKYYVLTEHLRSYFLWVASKKWLDGLSAQDRELVVGSLKKALAFANAYDIDDEMKLIVDLQKNGVDVVIPDRRAYQKKAGPAIKRLAESWAPGVAEEVVKVEGRDLY
jgi:TRAP-type C4-dicarboxylate transport system substrate-binding protein